MLQGIHSLTSIPCLVRPKNLVFPAHNSNAVNSSALPPKNPNLPSAPKRHAHLSTPIIFLTACLKMPISRLNESQADIKHKLMSDVQAATLDVSFLFSSVALYSHTDECSPVSPIWQRSVGSSENWDRQDHSVPPSRNRTSSQSTSAGHLYPRPRPNT
jgi:hypothetical protein